MRDKEIDAATTPGRRTRLHYFHGEERDVVCFDEEVPFPEGKLIVSQTDPSGIITFANPAFVEMSGYDRGELLGRQHSILRHPDMPAIAFQDLWDTVRQGKKWQGYVKNLRKDGRFYWVFATVIPNVREGRIVGYTSVRRKPSRTRVRSSEELYRKLSSGAVEEAAGV